MRSLCSQLKKCFSPRSARGLSYALNRGYLENSEFPSMFYQESLPRMPIPELDITLERYLRVLEPVVTPAEFDDATKAVKAFQQVEGPRLYQQLREYDDANPETSYIHKWWNEMYLKDRSPLPLNFNPQLELARDPDPDKMTQLQRASSMVTAAIRFVRTFETGRLSPDVYHTQPKPEWFDSVMEKIPVETRTEVAKRCGAYPLDMSQLNAMFRSTRIPRHDMDETVTQPIASERSSDHILVQRGADFFKLMITDSGGYELPREDIYAALKQISETPESQAAPIGVLTTLPRDEWATARASMESNPVNAATLADIDSALFVVCLDPEAPPDDASRARTFLHGDGRNRWFDKSFTLVFTEDGEAALVFEHSIRDGVSVVRFCNDLLAEATRIAPAKGHGHVSDGMVQPLRWHVDPQLERTVDEAGSRFDTWLSTLGYSFGATDLVNQSTAKTFKVSGDALMQMAMQLGHYNMHGTMVPTYEAASHAAFKHGRTECIRSATMEAKAFVESMHSETADVSVRAGLLKTALKQHSTNTKLALIGQGVDRLMFGLQKISVESTGLVPDVFQTAAHRKNSNFVISTTTLNTPSLKNLAFGPVNDDCYAFFYAQSKDASYFTVGSYRGDESDMATETVRALEDMVSILRTTKL